MSKSLKIYLGLVLALAVCNAAQIFLPAYMGLSLSAELPVSLPVLALANAGIAIFLYGGLGLLGLKAGEKLGYARIWEPTLNNRDRFLTPVIIGAVVGIILIASDVVFGKFNGIGRLLHPSFPASILASLSAGIGEEIMFRLFFIPCGVWLISLKILKGKWQNQTFWMISVISALAFALGHLPSFIILYETSLNQITPALITEIILLNGLLSLCAAYYLRKHGFLAAAGIHFWTDIVWHVVWGLF